MAYRESFAMPRILILESYGPTRQALAMILEREGWEVTLSQTDQEAFEALLHSDYDVLLIDLEMNTGDGWRVLQYLVPDPVVPDRVMPDRTTPIIAILDQESQHSQQAHDLGASAILYKPIRRKRLLDSAAAALNCEDMMPLQGPLLP
jgi:CheY-like chemotaxis protein